MSTWNNIVGWGFALPAVLGFLLFNLLPMLLSAYYSLCDYNIIKTPEWIGFQNYIDLFSGKERPSGSRQKPRCSMRLWQFRPI